MSDKIIYQENGDKIELDKKAVRDYKKQQRVKLVLDIIKSELSPELAEIYERHIGYLQTYHEIAQAMSLTYEQVRYRFYRAKKIIDARKEKK